MIGEQPAAVGRDVITGEEQAQFVVSGDDLPGRRQGELARLPQQFCSVATSSLSGKKGGII